MVRSAIETVPEPLSGIVPPPVHALVSVQSEVQKSWGDFDNVTFIVTFVCC